MSEPEYDEATCITAGELRAAGATGIPADVPDCAWVPRSAMVTKLARPTPEAMAAMEASGKLSLNLQVTVTTHWRWFETTVEIKGS